MSKLNIKRRKLVKAAGASVVAGSFVAGEVAAHRPSEIDWYAHEIVDCDGTEVLIEDNLPPDGNRFLMDRERLLAHIELDHGWSQTEVTEFETELTKLCDNLGTPDWDVLEWYSHKIVDCFTKSGTTYITVRDGLGYEFDITRSFLEDHIKNDHGWEKPDRDEFFDALDHYCFDH